MTTPTATVAPATPADRRAILDLFEHASLADPTYLPPVTDGTMSVEEWFDAKTLSWSRIALDGNAVVGFIGASREDPGRDPGRGERPGWEAVRLVVSPTHRGTGTGALLIQAAHRTFGSNLWARCVDGSPSHRLFASLGWSVFARPWLEISRCRGVALCAPDPNARFPA